MLTFILTYSTSPTKKSILILCSVVPVANCLSQSSSTGIGPVLNLRFNPSFSTIMWDPPSTAGVLGNLYYHVTLMNNVSSELIISETTDNTYYPLPALQRCQYYTTNVTAFSSEYHGDSVVYGQRAPGGVCVCVIGGGTGGARGAQAPTNLKVGGGRDPHFRAVSHTCKLQSVMLQSSFRLWLSKRPAQL